MTKPILQYFKAVGILFCIVIISHSLFFQISKSIKTPSNGAWGIFHYYIGAKYIKEIGYFNLYSCALTVNKDTWKSIEKVRDLKTYQIIPVNNLQRCPTKNFSKQRWNEFTKDVISITSRAPANYWSHAIADKGFNAPPFWAAIAGTIANIIPLNNLTYLYLFNLDLFFILLASLIVWYGSEKIVGLITLALSFLYFGTLNIIGSNYLQYVWLPLLAGAFVLWNKKSFGKSGVLLGLATGLQAFPGFFALPVFLIFIISVIKKRNNERTNALAFITTFIATLLFCLLIGSFYAGNVLAWNQWNKKITIQRNYINGEIFDIGFPNLAGTILSKDHSNSYTYIQDYIHTINRIKAIGQNSSLIAAATILLLLAVLLVLYHSSKSQPLPYGYFLVYFLTTLSPYYYLTLTLIPFVFWNNSPPVKRFALFGTIGLFLVHLNIFHYGGSVNFFYTQQLISESMIFLFFGVLLYLLFLETRVKK